MRKALGLLMVMFALLLVLGSAVMSCDEGESSLQQYTLKINIATAGGTTDPGPGIHTYESGTMVRVVALPNTNWVFSGWSGDVTASTVYVDITMNTDRALTASFVQEQQPTDPDPSSDTLTTEEYIVKAKPIIRRAKADTDDWYNGINEATECGEQGDLIGFLTKAMAVQENYCADLDDAVEQWSALVPPPEYEAFHNCYLEKLIAEKERMDEMNAGWQTMDVDRVKAVLQDCMDDPIRRSDCACVLPETDNGEIEDVLT